MLMRIYIKRVGIPGTIKVVDSEDFINFSKKVIGTNLDHTSLVKTHDGIISFFVDEYGAVKEPPLPINFTARYPIHGPAIFYKANTYGEDSSLTNNDIKLIQKLTGEKGTNPLVRRAKIRKPGLRCGKDCVRCGHSMCYAYQCDPWLGGCGAIFEITNHQIDQCPNCGMSMQIKACCSQIEGGCEYIEDING